MRHYVAPLIYHWVQSLAAMREVIMDSLQRATNTLHDMYAMYVALSAIISPTLLLYGVLDIHMIIMLRTSGSNVCRLC